MGKRSWEAGYRAGAGAGAGAELELPAVVVVVQLCWGARKRDRAYLVRGR